MPVAAFLLYALRSTAEHRQLRINLYSADEFSDCDIRFIHAAEHHLHHVIIQPLNVIIGKDGCLIMIVKDEAAFIRAVGDSKVDPLRSRSVGVSDGTCPDSRQMFILYSDRHGLIG